MPPVSTSGSEGRRGKAVPATPWHIKIMVVCAVTTLLAFLLRGGAISGGSHAEVKPCAMDSNTLKLIESAAEARLSESRTRDLLEKERSSGKADSEDAEEHGDAEACHADLARVKREAEKATEDLEKLRKETQGGGEGSSCPPCTSDCTQCNAASKAGTSAALAQVTLKEENLDVLKMEPAEMAKEIDDLRTLVTTLRQQLKQRGAPNGAADSDASAAELLELKKEMEMVKTQNKELKESLAKAKGATQEVTKEIEDLKSLVTSLRQQNQEIKGSVDKGDGAKPGAAKEVEELLSVVTSLRQQNKRLMQEAEEASGKGGDGKCSPTSPDDSQARAELASLKGQMSTLKDQLAAAKRQLESSSSGQATDSNVTEWKGYKCGATAAEMERYLGYIARQPCPDDWFFVQSLIFDKGCTALPRRRCRSRTPGRTREPMPLPESLYSQRALMNEGVRWDWHQCKSFQCLNARSKGRCLRCFNMTVEATRWKGGYRHNIPMEKVIAMKNGTLRIGLDVGGETGSFAARMAQHRVTILSTAENKEAAMHGHALGLPFQETIALRGLIPLHLPPNARLPFYDNVLDIVHSSNSINYIPFSAFEELLFEWDRVLRPGGLIWIERFYAAEDELPTYVRIIEQFGYSKKYWKQIPMTDRSEKPGPHSYLHCVLEKPSFSGSHVLYALKA